MYVDFAQRAGVADLEQFRQCLDSGQFADKAIEFDRARRAESIRLRPTFAIAGQLIPGAQSYDQLSQLIEAAAGAVEELSPLRRKGRRGFIDNLCALCDSVVNSLSKSAAVARR